MMQLQEVQKSAQTSDSSARELQLEAQLAEARCIIDEQVCWHLRTVMLGSNFRIVHMYSVQDDQQQLSASLKFYNDSLACEPHIIVCTRVESEQLIREVKVALLYL